MTKNAHDTQTAIILCTSPKLDAATGQKHQTRCAQKGMVHTLAGISTRSLTNKLVDWEHLPLKNLQDPTTVPSTQVLHKIILYHI